MISSYSREMKTIFVAAAATTLATIAATTTKESSVFFFTIRATLVKVRATLVKVPTLVYHTDYSSLPYGLL